MTKIILFFYISIHLLHKHNYLLFEIGRGVTWANILTGSTSK